jgi:hypothetical protein
MKGSTLALANPTPMSTHPPPQPARPNRPGQAAAPVSSSTNAH